MLDIMDYWFSAKIFSLPLNGIDIGNVLDMVPGRHVLGIVLVHIVGVLDAVVVHQRQAMFWVDTRRS